MTKICKWIEQQVISYGRYEIDTEYRGNGVVQILTHL